MPIGCLNRDGRRTLPDKSSLFTRHGQAARRVACGLVGIRAHGATVAALGGRHQNGSSARGTNPGSAGGDDLRAAVCTRGEGLSDR